MAALYHSNRLFFPSCVGETLILWLLWVHRQHIRWVRRQCYKCDSVSDRNPMSMASLCLKHCIIAGRLLGARLDHTCFTDTRSYICEGHMTPSLNSSLMIHCIKCCAWSKYVTEWCSILHLMFTPLFLKVLAPVVQTLLIATVCMALAIVVDLILQNALVT